MLDWVLILSILRTMDIYSWINTRCQDIEDNGLKRKCTDKRSRPNQLRRHVFFDLFVGNISPFQTRVAPLKSTCPQLVNSITVAHNGSIFVGKFGMKHFINIQQTKRWDHIMMSICARPSKPKGTLSFTLENFGRNPCYCDTNCCVVSSNTHATQLNPNIHGDLHHGGEHTKLFMLGVLRACEIPARYTFIEERYRTHTHKIETRTWNTVLEYRARERNVFHWTSRFVFSGAHAPLSLLPKGACSVYRQDKDEDTPKGYDVWIMVTTAALVI